MPTQIDKGRLFRALHMREGLFIIPNPWDRGTARLLAHLGFEALATTSMGFAFSAGLLDNTVGRDAVMKHIAEIAPATDLPVSADLENGFGDAPETAAETIRLAAAAGAVGGSIEDASGDPQHPIYEKEHAAEKIRAAAEAARSLPFTFTLTGRAENYLHGRLDIRDTIARAAGLSGSGRGCLICTGAGSQRRHRRGDRRGGSSRECADGIERRATQRSGPRGDGSQAGQRRQRALPHGVGRVSACRARDVRPRHFYLRQGGRQRSRDQRDIQDGAMKNAPTSIRSGTFGCTVGRPIMAAAAFQAAPAFTASRMSLAVLRLGLLEDRNVRVGVLPESQELLIGGLRLDLVSRQCERSAEL